MPINVIIELAVVYIYIATLLIHIIIDLYVDYIVILNTVQNASVIRLDESREIIKFKFGVQ